MLPVILTSGIRSFIRLRDFKNVDFPQPEGPMSAVMACSGISSVISLSAWDGPYQRHISFIEIIVSI